MSIITTWTNSFPMPLLGMADSTEAQRVSGLIEDNAWEVCACDGCEFVETAFVNNGGEWWKNDKKSFIRARRFSTDTITFSLRKDGAQVAVLNNNTYGEYYNFGSAFLINGNYKGFIIDWDLVQQAFGYGRYIVRTTHVSLGTTYTYDSHPFNVVEYNARRADGTVRIETYQSGQIMSGFDYSGIGWYQSLRLEGKFGNKIPELIIDNYQDANRNVRQIQSKIDNTYTLETHLIPVYISDYLNEDAILANDIYITDYNTLNQDLYRRKHVYVSGIKTVVNHNYSKKSNYVYEFKAKTDNIIKRNVEGDAAIFPQQTAATRVVEIKNLTYLFSFDAGESETSEATLTADMEGTLDALTQDGASGTITYSKNGGAFVSTLPVSFVAGDTIIVKRTSTAAEGYAKYTGEYV